MQHLTELIFFQFQSYVIEDEVQGVLGDAFKQLGLLIHYKLFFFPQE